MTRFGLIHKYARVWNEAPWVERLMWKQQEMRYMWNSKHAFDGGAFYRTMGRFTGTITLYFLKNIFKTNSFRESFLPRRIGET